MPQGAWRCLSAKGHAPAEGVAQQAGDDIDCLDQRIQAQVHAAAMRNPQLAL